MMSEKKANNKKRLSEAEKEVLLQKYREQLRNNGGLTDTLADFKLDNEELKALVKKNPNRLIGGCG